MSSGKNIQNQRKIKGMSQEKVAEQCKVTRQTVSRWECDEVLPDTNNLISLSKLFEVSLDTLVFSENAQEIDIQPQKNKWKNKCFLFRVYKYMSSGRMSVSFASQNVCAKIH